VKFGEVFPCAMFRLLIIFLLFTNIGFGQKRINFAAIDWNVRNIETPTVDSLAKKIAASYQTDIEKTRAIFSWIAQHISYNTGIFNAGKGYRPVKFVLDPDDTVSSKSAIEQTAERVFKRRIAVCDGYAKLFKALCDYAGIESEVILGYGKCYLEKDAKFRTNHTWNAVKIDSAWHLLDVTWASGYVSFANEFVQHLDESYFLTPPQQFISDHYPEDLKWTLLERPPALREFHFSPFKYKSFVKYGIASASPPNGTIEANIGDTIQIELKLKDPAKDSLIAPDVFFDSTIIQLSPASVFLAPIVEKNRAVYIYVIQSNDVQWIHLLYNEDPVLRYKLIVKSRESTK
jgi:transglutaminase/protease-like cytokinesis protein 3